MVMARGSARGVPLGKGVLAADREPLDAAEFAVEGGQVAGLERAVELSAGEPPDTVATAPWVRWIYRRAVPS